jgi:ribulose-phosphate 3-epimerase
MAVIAPSLFAAEFARLGEALELIKTAGAPMVHLEVSDGHFAPGITAGQPVLRSVRRATDLVLDVHLLVERPERYAGEFVEAGADRVSVHAEATTNLNAVLEMIRGRGALAGVALNPATHLDAVAEVLGQIDFLTVLAADPGLKPEIFCAGSLAKVQAASRARAERHMEFEIEVEGGMTEDRGENFIRAGADILVAGSAIFDNSDPKTRLAEWIRSAAATPFSSSV